MKYAIIGKDIRKSFPIAGGRLEVLRGANIEVPPGEMVAIKGASGVGKSTLLHILGALDSADSGYIEIGGVKLNGMRDYQKAWLRNRRIGFIFQFYHLLSDFDVLENVLFPAMIGRRFFGPEKKKLVRRARELLETTGLKERARHKPGELSGGEQQRVAMARALMNEPEIIMADEPTGNLDTVTSESIHTLLKDLNRRLKKTMIIVTHDDRLAGMCDRTLHMVDGVIVDR